MHDLSVLITTVCRNSLLRAVESVYRQSFGGRIQILIGVDVDLHNNKKSIQAEIEKRCPNNVDVCWIDVGYSTSRRHGGVHDCFFGGSLRSALTFLADAEIVVYLDDDDWLHPDHLNDILKALEGNKWAFSYSYFADGNTGKALCVDQMESVGVNQGIFKEQFGGFVRPSGLAIRKKDLLPIVHLWACSPFPTGDGEDRLIFDRLRHEKHGCTGRATAYYSLDPKDGMHPHRVAYMRSRGVVFDSESKEGSVR